MMVLSDLHNQAKSVGGLLVGGLLVCGVLVSGSYGVLLLFQLGSCWRGITITI